MTRNLIKRSALLSGLALGLFSAAPAMAIKPFTLVEDGYPEVKGTVELENTFEALWHSLDDPHQKEFGMEHELEFQLTEKFSLRVKGAYVYQDSSEGSSFHFDSGAIEGQYYFTNPIVDPIGISVIGVASVGERGAGGFEAFLVLQKDWDKLTVAYNLGFGTDIDNLYSGGSRETAGTLINSLGGIYSVAKNLRVGAEISAESSYAEWRHYGETLIWAGPVMSWTPSANLWVTAGVDYQISGERSEAQYRASVIVGYYF
ncbi:hypothetical protein [Humisphaera borealis]|uniref:Transporter n=1 Tax=Humisphaera borealis TaxID=2807512 RepID=A0A7M2WW07_9BACT|nr:hypothetical protein [Humisphaera borealis]QOV89514.1 hypothetical protein IPV69_25525 [Humisphaera borealis]